TGSLAVDLDRSPLWSRGEDNVVSGAGTSRVQAEPRKMVRFLRSTRSSQVNRSKFDQQIVPSSVERPDETAQSRRHLMRLTEVDAELHSTLEPVADR
ncbi:hypothetical protein AB9E34_32930, partial [Rhizobium leguminosarum]